MNVNPQVLLEAARRLARGEYKNIQAAIMAVMSELEQQHTRN